jgi:hypothetical protein
MADLKLPRDGGGIKWSTAKAKVREVKLENGAEVDSPVYQQPFAPYGSPRSIVSTISPGYDGPPTF